MTTTTPYRIDWPKIGQSFSDENRDAIASWLENLDNDSRSHAGFNHWHQLGGDPVSLPFSQGYAIKAAIREFRLPKVSHVAHGGECRFGLIAMQAHYKQGRVDVVMMDDGVSLTPVACRVWEGGAG